MGSRAAAALLVLAVHAANCAQAQVQPPNEFYRENPINFVVGSAPGGSHDIYARLLARHLSRFLPGEPRIAVQNMPGAGSLRAASYLYNFAPLRRHRDRNVLSQYAGYWRSRGQLQCSV